MIDVVRSPAAGGSIPPLRGSPPAPRSLLSMPQTTHVNTALVSSLALSLACTARGKSPKMFFSLRRVAMVSNVFHIKNYSVNFIAIIHFKSNQLLFSYQHFFLLLKVKKTVGYVGYDLVVFSSGLTFSISQLLRSERVPSRLSGHVSF